MAKSLKLPEFQEILIIIARIFILKKNPIGRCRNGKGIMICPPRGPIISFDWSTIMIGPDGGT